MLNCHETVRWPDQAGFSYRGCRDCGLPRTECSRQIPPQQTAKGSPTPSLALPTILLAGEAALSS